MPEMLGNATEQEGGMKGVIIPVDMPDKCWFCKFSHPMMTNINRLDADNSLFVWCYLLGNMLEPYERHPDCPLKPVDGLVGKIEGARRPADDFIERIRAASTGFKDGKDYGIDKALNIIREYCGCGNEG